MSDPVIICECLSPGMLQGVIKITLNRPEVYNALDEQLIEELSRAFLDFGEDSAVRVIVLAATGKLFSAGADLKGMKKCAALSLQDNIEDSRKLSRLLTIIDTCPKPTIALVQGAAYGGGVGLIAACDISVCVGDAVFCLPEVRLGLVPAVISPYIIKAIGQRQTRRYVLTAECMSAPDALRLGLIHQVVREGELEATGESLAVSILKGSPEALRAAKDLIHFVESRPIDEAIHEETARCIALIRQSAEGQEGVDAFLNKRMPFWQSERDKGCV